MTFYSQFVFGCIAILQLTTTGYSNIEELQKRIDQDLEWTGYPDDWLNSDENVLDVAIIGAGMAGSAAAFALKRVGIHHIRLFDESPKGKEGPWITSAKMQILRTSKCAVGPGLNFPSLTFQAWYEAKFGQTAWDQFSKATPRQWMDYLIWFRKTLNLPISNDSRLMEIVPTEKNHFKLFFECQKKPHLILAKKIVLATGRTGFGCANIPQCLVKIQKQFYAHTSESINYNNFKDKEICIIGCGSSAFDAAGASLEAGAKKVTLLFRRKEIPQYNRLAAFAHVGAERGFHLLPDCQRYHLIDWALEPGIAPPSEAIERVAQNPRLFFQADTKVEKISFESGQLNLEHSQGHLLCDRLILATGYRVDGNACQELKNLMPFIDLWENHIEPVHLLGKEHFGCFPYLSSSYQFKEKVPGTAPYLENVYCFNFGSLMSHGLTTSSIDSINVGAERLAEGIAADFFKNDIKLFENNIKH